MHAARALNAQRKRREEKILAEKTRRQSAVSGRSASRSPVPSVDLEAGNKRKKQKSSGVDCAYVGFIIAIFGAVPLLVGTFITVPALWEVGLGLTLIGLFIGVSFWCCDFCVRQATKDYEEQMGGDARFRRGRGGKVEDASAVKPLEQSFKNGRSGSAHSLQSVKSGTGSFSTPTKGHLRKSPEVHLETVSEVENPISRHTRSPKDEEESQVMVVVPGENETNPEAHLTNVIMVNSESSPSSVPLAAVSASNIESALTPVDDFDSTLASIEDPDPSPPQDENDVPNEEPQPEEAEPEEEEASEDQPNAEESVEGPEETSEQVPQDNPPQEDVTNDEGDNDKAPLAEPETESSGADSTANGGDSQEDDTEQILQNSDEINKEEAASEAMELEEAIAEIESATDPDPAESSGGGGDDDKDEPKGPDGEDGEDKGERSDGDGGMDKEALESGSVPDTEENDPEISDEKLGDEISKILENSAASIVNEGAKDPEIQVGI